MSLPVTKTALTRKLTLMLRQALYHAIPGDTEGVTFRWSEDPKLTNVDIVAAGVSVENGMSITRPWIVAAVEGISYTRAAVGHADRDHADLAGVRMIRTGTATLVVTINAPSRTDVEILQSFLSGHLFAMGDALLQDDLPLKDLFVDEEGPAKLSKPNPNREYEGTIRLTATFDDIFDRRVESLPLKKISMSAEQTT